MKSYTATVKRSIKPISVTVTLEATRINENGTLSGFSIKTIQTNGGKAKFTAVTPPQGGGSIYIKAESLEGITLLDDTVKATATKTKLF